MNPLDYLGQGNLLIAIGFAVFLVLLFLILREFVTWYWKINEEVSVLKEINENLKSINAWMALMSKKAGESNMVKETDHPSITANK